jgi:hypothetical protein
MSTLFHQIQALGKETVQLLANVILQTPSRLLPANYLKVCSLIYQAFKRGNSRALQHIPAMIEYQKYERIDQLDAAFAL